MQPATRDRLRTALVAEEGCIAHMYLDTTGHVTVGIGHLLAGPHDAAALSFVSRASGEAATKAQIENEFEKIRVLPKGRGVSFYAKTATLELTPNRIDALLTKDVDEKESELRRVDACKGFDSFPESAQQALLDLAFNLGTHKLTHEFVRLMAHVESRNWAGAATECAVRNVQQSRNDARAALFEQAASESRDTPSSSKSRQVAAAAAARSTGKTARSEPSLPRRTGKMSHHRKSSRRVRRFLSDAAPYLASVLIPNGPLAGVAVDFVRKKLGADKLNAAGKGADHEGVTDFLHKMTDSLDGLKEVKELDRQFKLEMEKLEIDVFALEIDDRKDARALANNDLRPYIYFSVLFVLSYFVVLGGVFYAEISPSFNPGSVWVPPVEGCVGPDRSTCNGSWEADEQSLLDLIHVLLGVLTAGIAQVLNFWFGGLMNNQPSATATS